MKDRVTVVIPAHNEAGRIGPTVAAVSPYADQVIVVDDAGTDGTGDEAREAGAEVIALDPGRGYIGAIKAGFARASGDIVVTVDGDGEHPASAIPDLVAPIVRGEADMVQGSREHAPRVSEAWLTHLAALAGPVGDSGTGMRALRSDLAQQLEIHGRCICGTLSLEAIRRGARIIDVPITLQQVDKPRGIAWYHVPQVGIVLREMWQTRARVR